MLLTHSDVLHFLTFVIKYFMATAQFSLEISEMASLFADVNTGEERLEFSGSSSEDIACAKLFWQTVCLLPHLESGLVSSDVSQRRRSAPLPGNLSVCRISHYRKVAITPDFPGQSKFLRN